MTTLSDTADLDRALGAFGGGTVVAAGGDGTLHLLAQHLWDHAQLTEIVVGLLPLGTGNDFARSVGIPLDPEAAAAVVVSGTPRTLDLLVDDAGGVAVNAVHCGVGGLAVRHADPLKPWLGRAAYKVGAAWAGARSAGWQVRVEVDDHVLVEGKVLFVGVGNGATIGGGTVIWPDARPDDGLAEVVVAAAGSTRSRLELAAALRRGRPDQVAGAVTGRGASVRVWGDPVPHIADGERGPSSSNRSWQVRAAAWRLLAPTREEARSSISSRGE